MSRRTARPVFVLKPLVIGLLALHGPAVLAEEVPAAAPVVTPAVAPVAAQTPAQAQAQSQATATESTVLEPVEVESAAADEALPSVSSPKYTAPLRDTPQSVQVIPKRIIEEQGQLTLRDMLGNVPGITLGAAEGGNGFGDNITLRGARIENDIQVDGIRDSAQTTRVDPFNLEQLEITKGASSVYSGGGAVAGAINMVSKTAKKDEFVKLGAGIGTDNYYRATVDANTMLGDTTALRVNVMTHENDTPDRDHVWAKRWGIATSLAFGLGTDTRFSLNYLHQDNERVPDRGILWRRPANPGVGAPVPVDRSTYFGWSNTDRETAVIDTLTALLEKDINESLSLRNATRFAKTENYSNSATMNGLVCIGGVPFNATGTCPTAGDTFSISTNIGNVRDDETAILANVTDLTWNFSTGGVGHTLVTGLSVSVEDFERTSRQPRNLDGSAFTPADDLVNRPVRDLHNPDTVWRGPIHYRRTGSNDNQVKNHAVYAFDTMKLSPQWEFNTGVRYERNEASYVTRAFDAATGAQTSVTPGESNEDLVSGRVGLVFKPVENGSVYVAAGNSLAPSASTVIAGCTATGNNQNCNVDPEKTVNYELGTKWDLLDSRLALTAALFRNDRTNVRVNDLVTTDPQVLDGRQRVDGFDIGASGKITSNWAISAAYAFLDSEVLQGAAAGAPVDSQKGQDIAGTPRHSGNVWTTYLLSKGVELGYGIRYVGEYYTEAAAVTTTVPDYTLHNAMIGYAVTRDLSLRLNLNNLTDEVYWSAVRSHGWGNPGEGRSAVLSLNYNLR